MPATTWTELSVTGSGWVQDVYGPGFSGDYIVIGGAVLPATPDGTPVASAATSSVEWTEGSQTATTFTEQSVAAGGFTEVEG